MEQVKVDTVRKVVWVAVDFTAGLTDLVLAVRKPAGTLVTPAPTFTEQGDGVYVAEYTPDAIGVWQEKVSSAVNGDKAVRSVTVVANDADSVKTAVGAVETKVDTAITKVDAVDAKVVTANSKIDAVDAKVVTVDGKVDTVVTGVAAIKNKTDNLPANTATELTALSGKLDTVEGKIDGLDTQIKPGGYFA